MLWAELPAHSHVFTAHKHGQMLTPRLPLTHSDFMALASTATARRSPRTAIFCGAPQPLSTADFDPQPWSVRFLPLQDTPPPAVRRTKSNGCGSKVHTAAIPNEAESVWCGSYAELTGAVVALDDKYVPEVLKPILKSRREGCGCLRSPVGCAVW
jgi:hypothetical protein